MTPNPLIPQGSLQSAGTSNVRIAVATIVAIHVVFFGGLLLQGCKRDTPVSSAETTNEPTNTATTSSLTYPPIDSQNLYYSNTAGLPSEAPAASATSATVSASSTIPPNFYTAPSTPEANSQTDPWRNSTLGGTTTASASTGTPAAAGGKEYTVQRGDSFWSIAQRNGTTIAAIRQANPGVDPRKIQPGQKLTIPAGSPAGSETSSAASSSSSTAGNVYVVVPGDNLTRIARKHGVTISQLREANNLRYSRVDAGQKLIIPAAASNKPASTPNTF